MILLDTNVLSELMRPQPDHAVLAFLRATAVSELAVTAVTVLEIRYGLATMPGGSRKQDKQARFETLVARAFEDRVLAFDQPAAEATATLMAERRRRGESLDDHLADAMIAGIARAGGHTLATRNLGQFRGTGVAITDPFSAT